MHSSKLLKLLFFVLFIASAINLEAKVIRSIKATIVPDNIVKIDSVDYRATLTRVYARIVGRPHTSMRIDSITGAKDIDGIDFKRWFQFEEEGIVSIEIDFDSKNYRKGFIFNIVSSKGEIKCSISGK